MKRRLRRRFLRPSAFSHQSLENAPAAPGLLFTVHRSLFTADRSLFTVHGSRFTVHGSRFPTAYGLKPPGANFSTWMVSHQGAGAPEGNHGFKECQAVTAGACFDRGILWRQQWWRWHSRGRGCADVLHCCHLSGSIDVALCVAVSRGDELPHVSGQLQPAWWASERCQQC